MASHLRLNEAGAAHGAGEGARAPSAARVTVAGLTGALATMAALAIGSIVAVVFAATLAVVLVLAASLLALVAAAWRFRRPTLRGAQVRGSKGGPVLEAHKVGHSWVAYGWDQQP